VTEGRTVSDRSSGNIDRVTLNLSGDEAMRLLGALDHLTKTTTGDAEEQYESIYSKLERSIGAGTDGLTEGSDDV